MPLWDCFFEIIPPPMLAVASPLAAWSWPLPQPLPRWLPPPTLPRPAALVAFHRLPRVSPRLHPPPLPLKPSLVIVSDPTSSPATFKLCPSTVRATPSFLPRWPIGKLSLPTETHFPSLKIIFMDSQTSPNTKPFFKPRSKRIESKMKLSVFLHRWRCFPITNGGCGSSDGSRI